MPGAVEKKRHFSIEVQMLNVAKRKSLRLQYQTMPQSKLNLKQKVSKKQDVSL